MGERISKLKICIIIIIFISFINPASSQTAGEWVEKGNALYDSGEYDKAIEAFNKAIAIDLNFKEAWNEKGIVLMYLGEDDKAIEAFDKIIALYPDDISLKKNRNYIKMKPWLIISGIAFLTVIGIITVRNIRYNRNNKSKNVNPDHNINKWKIFGYVLITGAVFSFLVEISAIIFSTYPFENMNKVVWAWMPLLFGVVMAYRLKKNIEFVYAFIIFFIVILFGGIGVGILVSLGYFGWSYSKLEKQKLGSSSCVEKQEARKLWSHFKGMVNTDEVLIEKAKFLAPILVDLINEDTKSLFEELKEDEEIKIDDEKFGEVFFEMVLFNLHYVDRIAFQHLGAEKRNIFMDTLVIEVSEAFSRVYESGIEAVQFRSSFVEAYAERQDEYAKYKKSVPEKDEGAKDTLFWEFGKKISGVLGIENNVFVNMRITNHTFIKYKFLELSELFGEEK